jgi:heat shock 70kDa protein 1/2/6/8
VPYAKDPSLPAYETQVLGDESEEPWQEQHSVQEVTAKYLAKLRETAEYYLSAKVTGCVISIPAHFEDAQKEALMQSAHTAGFTKAFPLHEPVAACLAFDAVSEDVKEDQEILVLDLGAKQFNITHVTKNDGLYAIQESLEFNDVAGAKIDHVLVEFARLEFQRKYKVDVGDNRRAMEKLRIACERTKRSLTRQDTAPLSVDSLYDGMDYNGTVIRARFEMLCDPHYNQCKTAVIETLAKTGLKIQDVDQVLLIGGASRIPRFQAQMKGMFPETTKVRTDVEPDEAISIGCAIQAQMMEAEKMDIEKVDVAPKAACLSQAIGFVNDGQFIPMIPKGTPLPVRRAVSLPIADDQLEAYLCLYQNAATPAMLVECVLSDLEAAKDRKVEVVVVIEAEGQTTVSVSEKMSGQKMEVQVQ